MLKAGAEALRLHHRAVARLREVTETDAAVTFEIVGPRSPPMAQRPLLLVAGALALLLAGCVGEDVLGGCQVDADCATGEVCRAGACEPGGPGCPESEQRELFEDGDGDHVGGTSLGAFCPGAVTPARSTDLPGDCNDADPEVGQYFPDADGDGAGTNGSVADLSCVGEVGKASAPDDCNDSDPSVRPDPVGACTLDPDNGLAVCPAGSPCSTDDADALLLGAAADAAGRVAAGDFDGDGFADLAVGAYNYGGERGRVYVLFGPIRRGVTELATEALALESEGAGAALGESVASAGDVDGDGLVDLLVGTHHEPGVVELNAAGRAYLVLGESLRALKGEGAARSAPIKSAAAAIYLEGSTDRAWLRLRGIGGAELDDDPGADLLLGAELSDDPETEAAGAVGQAFVVPGRCRAPAGERALEVQLGGVPSCDLGAGPIEGAVISGEVDGARVGSQIVAADLDGVPPLDLLVLSAGASEVRGFLGPIAGPRSWAEQGAIVFRGGRGVIAPGDLDGDGDADLLFLAQAPDPAATAIVALSGPFGGPAGYDVPALLLEGASSREGLAEDGFAEALSVPGDLDGDGVKDVLATAYRAGTPPDVNQGAAHLYSGAAFDAPAPAGELVITSVLPPNSNFGSTDGTAGDFDGDGSPDLVIGANAWVRPEDPSVWAGAIHVFFGPWAGRAP